MTLVSRDAVADRWHAAQIPTRTQPEYGPYLDADVDEVYVQQIGPDRAGSLPVRNETCSRNCSSGDKRASITLLW